MKKVVFKKMFEPGFIGSMEVKNRLTMAATGTIRASENGLVEQSQKYLYEARAKGGLGLIVVEIACVDFPQGKRIKRQISIDSDRFIPGLRDLATVIKKHGARAVIQLHHAGNAAYEWASGMQPVGPSAIERRPYALAKELDLHQIKGIVDKFGKAAERAKRAGFDGVEIHAGHDYLIAEFLSKSFNKRKDEYGGSLNNRARLMVEVIRACKESAGEKYPVWCRINGEELNVKDGITRDESRKIAKISQDSGADAVSVSAIGYGGRNFLYQMPLKPGTLVPLAANIKRVVSVPVFAVGRLEPKVAELTLKKGRADFVALSRAVISDPEFANKCREGVIEDIVPCIACYHCIRPIFPDVKACPDDASECTVNPAYGTEEEIDGIKLTEKPKKVLVIGGGPGGMQAARVAALRGHKVTLCEKEAFLGGQLRLASKPSSANHFNLLNRFLIRQIHKAGVIVELNKEVTAELVQTLAPDAVIVAIGGKGSSPNIRGIERKNVIKAKDALDHPESVGQRVAVIGGQKIGVRTAQFLAERGKTVTILNRSRVGSNFQPLFNATLSDVLRENGVLKLNNKECKKITDKGIVIINDVGDEEFFEADTVIIATGCMPNNALFEALKGGKNEVYQVGDCVQPRDLTEAVKDGYRVGLTV